MGPKHTRTLRGSLDHRVQVHTRGAHRRDVYLRGCGISVATLPSPDDRLRCHLGHLCLRHRSHRGDTVCQQALDRPDRGIGSGADREPPRRGGASNLEVAAWRPNERGLSRTGLTRRMDGIRRRSNRESPRERGGRRRYKCAAATRRSTSSRGPLSRRYSGPDPSPRSSLISATPLARIGPGRSRRSVRTTSSLCAEAT
jgi:hypothetical protein